MGSVKTTCVHVIVLCLFPALVSGSTHTVNPGGTGDYATVKAAVTAAAPGDTVELTMGTFTGTGNRDVDFLGKAITIRSQYGIPQYTIIDCEGSEGDPHRGFTFTTSEASTSILEGIKIVNGHNLYGGAIYMSGASPTIMNCIFEDNMAQIGSSGNGGAIYAFNSSPVVENCTFASNYARSLGGGMYFEETSMPTVSHCIFDNNFAGYGRGGGICLDLESSLTVLSSTFYANMAASGGSIYSGQDCSASVENTIIAFGAAGGAVGCDGTGSAALSCCDVYDNAGGDWTGCIAGQDILNDNISANPRFCRPDIHNFRLHMTSPCLADSNPVCGLIGAEGLGCGPSTFIVAPDGSGTLPTIQAAVNTAWDGDKIYLENGTFTGEGNRDVDYLGKALTITSQSGNADSCIIDCEADSSDHHRGFAFTSGEDTLSVLEAVTIMNGYMPSGGGIHCESGSSPRIADCILKYNAAGHGGGASLANGSASVSGCVFLGNIATDDSGGGGLYAAVGSPAIFGCTFYDNTADSGAAVSCFGATLTLENTILAFNNQGAAFHCDAGASCSPTLYCCDVYANEGGDYAGCIAVFQFLFGNMRQDPRFCDAPAGDLTLHNTSPCAAANNPTCGRVGAHGVGCGPRTFVVNPAGTGDFPTIQEAVDAAWDGDIIELTDGTFTGAGNRDIDMGGQAITLRSQSGNPESCVIDCEGSYAEPHRGLYLTDEDMGQAIEGITITGGWAETAGGGIYATESGVDISNCVISGCSAGEDNVMLVQGFGGGMYLGTGCLGDVSGCVITGNDALYGGLGGGAYVYDDASITFTSCTFVSNLADSGSGICVNGNSAVDIDNTIIAWNVLGEAVGCDITSSATCTCTNIYMNDGGSWGGCLAGQLDTNGNMYANPRFCNMAAGNYHIHNTSDCAPANSGGCGLIGALPVGCGPSTYVVNPAGTGDYPTIEEALDAVWPGDTVELTDGTFTGAGNRDIDIGWGFMLDDVTLRSQSGDPSVCVIDCQADSMDQHYGLNFLSSVDSTTVVEGVMFTNAYGPWGAAVTCNHSDPKFVNCHFYHNAAAYGGSAVYALSSRSTFTNCTFSDNSQGAVKVSEGEVKLFGCVFTNNSDDGLGGALSASGVVEPDLELIECQFNSNEAGISGGALYFAGDSLRVSRCSFYSNDAVEQGGAIQAYPSYAYINRSTFAENSAAEGAGVYLDHRSECHAILSNLIIAFSPEGEAVRCDTTDVISVSCCDFYANAGGDWVGPLSSEYGIHGNISLDPYFCDLALGDLTLDIASPCAAANAPPGCGQIGYYSPICDQASVPGGDTNVMDGLGLGSAIPNPFGGITTITYSIPQSSEGRHAVLKLYDARGRCVRSLVDAPASPGIHAATWDGTDEAGNPVASGIYFHRLTCDGESITRRVVLLR
jgi:hypothetical protein